MLQEGNIEEVLDCGEEKAKQIRDIFQKAVGAPLGPVSAVPRDMKGTLLETRVQDTVYYLKVSSIFRLREIRRDDPKGKVIYQLLY